VPLQTFEVHKDKGAITNLVAIHRPLSLFGLTANMQGYEPGDLKPLQKQLSQDEPLYQVGIQTNTFDAFNGCEDYITELAGYEELQFLTQQC
jgi:hypothetical protein